MDKINYQWVNSDALLQNYCAQVQQNNEVVSRYLFIDTEFVRTRTFYAQLGLIQLYDGKTLALVDALAITDYSPLNDLFKDQTIMKVLYAAGEDLDIFLHQLLAPQPYLDAQLMIAFLGKGLSFGFANAVEHYLGILVDKSASRSNWLQRPLTDIQCQYAAADVYYLAPLFDKLLAEIQQGVYYDAVLYESQQAILKRQCLVEPDRLYRKFKNGWQLSPKQLAILKPAVAWRYEQARLKDRAINFVVHEDSLFKLATVAPRTQSELLSCGFSTTEVDYYGQILLTFVAQAALMPSEQYPLIIPKPMDNNDDKKLLDMLKKKVEQVATEQNLEPTLLASKKQLHKLLKRQNESDEHYQQRMVQLDIFKDWRAPLLKDALLTLIS